MMNNDPLLMIPGMMCDARLFTPQIDMFSHDRMIVVAPLVGDTITEIATRILDQAPLRFALAGLSMGGIVAMEMWAQAPDRISRIALLDTNPKAEHPKVAVGREPQIAAALAGDLTGRPKALSLICVCRWLKPWVLMHLCANRARCKPALISRTHCAASLCLGLSYVGRMTRFARSTDTN